MRHVLVAVVTTLLLYSCESSGQQEDYLDYEIRADLRLPFEGQWWVAWGGRDPEQNQHAASRSERFGYDFLVLNDESTHQGDGLQNEDYYCWGRVIVAPGRSRVIAAVSDRPDNVPGEMDRENKAGNHLILDLGNSEYALLAHLRQGTVRLEIGAELEKGQEIGQCGNSGNTSEPHLHFHLQNSPDLGQGDGLPAFFHGYLSDGINVERGEPVRGEIIAHGNGD